MSDARPGRFIVLEGGEGVGKSTQARLLAERIQAAGVPVTSCREPGGTVAGDRIRDLLLDRAHTGLEPRAELLLYEASRAELVAKVIEPRLRGGDYVVCDRFTDSTLAYQGFGRGLDLEAIGVLNVWATGGLEPDVVIVLDLDPQVGLRRATGAGADRLEAEDPAFHARVREGFLRLAESGGYAVVDASLPVAETADLVWDLVRTGDARLAGEGGRS